MNRRDRLGDEWEPRWKTRMLKHELKKMRDRKLPYPPELTNKQRNEIRRKARKDALKIVKEAVKNV